MKKTGLLFIIFLLGCVLSGCSGEEIIKQDGEYYLYYTNIDENGLEHELYRAKAAQTDALIREFIEKLGNQPQDIGHVNLLPNSVQILNYRYEDENLELNMSESYGELAPGREILSRAGLVKTLIQIDGVGSVTILVDGEPLANSKGVAIGIMNEQTFVENSGKEINSYLHTTLTVYFTNVQGDRLIKENRKLYYSSNVPLERVVVEQVVKGPKGENHYPAIVPEVTILGVTAADGICYVNMAKNFADQGLNVQQEIPVYAIVNSLIDNCNVSQVQISIEGQSNLIFRESMDLNQFYKKNRELILEEN